MCKELDDDWLDVNDAEAIAYIRKYLPPEISAKIDDSQINEIIETMYRFYEEKGIIEENEQDTSIDIDEDELISYIRENSDEEIFIQLTINEIQLVMRAELAYCDSL